MKHRFEDLIKAAGNNLPQWYDENGVPRFCAFDPYQVSNIYATEAVLMEIACQSCGDIYHVGMSSSRSQADEKQSAFIAKAFMYGVKRGDVEASIKGIEGLESKFAHVSYSIAERIKDKTLHYGDPPNTGCCASGASMNSLPLRVLQYWTRENYKMVRKPEFEVDLAEKSYYDENYQKKG